MRIYKKKIYCRSCRRFDCLAINTRKKCIEVNLTDIAVAGKSKFRLKHNNSTFLLTKNSFLNPTWSDIIDLVSNFYDKEVNKKNEFNYFFTFKGITEIGTHGGNPYYEIEGIY